MCVTVILPSQIEFIQSLDGFKNRYYCSDKEIATVLQAMFILTSCKPSSIKLTSSRKAYGCLKWVCLLKTNKRSLFVHFSNKAFKQFLRTMKKMIIFLLQ